RTEWEDPTLGERVGDTRLKGGLGTDDRERRVNLLGVGDDGLRGRRVERLEPRREGGDPRVPGARTAVELRVAVGEGARDGVFATAATDEKHGLVHVQWAGAGDLSVVLHRLIRIAGTRSIVRVDGRTAQRSIAVASSSSIPPPISKSRLISSSASSKSKTALFRSM